MAQLPETMPTAYHYSLLYTTRRLFSPQDSLTDLNFSLLKAKLACEALRGHQNFYDHQIS